MTDFKNPSQREKEEVLRNDTYFRRATVGLDLDSPGGRFRAGEEISGTEASVRYPRLPSSSPWAADNVGVEPPTGVEIDAQEPTGTAEEIERSLVETAKAPTPVVAVSATPLAAPSNAAPLGSPTSSSDVEQLGGVAISSTLRKKLDRLIPQLVKRRKL
jgi:hypothetical protein